MENRVTETILPSDLSMPSARQMTIRIRRDLAPIRQLQWQKPDACCEPKRWPAVRLDPIGLLQRAVVNPSESSLRRLFPDLPECANSPRTFWAGEISSISAIFHIKQYGISHIRQGEGFSICLQSKRSSAVLNGGRDQVIAEIRRGRALRAIAVPALNHQATLLMED